MLYFQLSLIHQTLYIPDGCKGLTNSSMCYTVESNGILPTWTVQLKSGKSVEINTCYACVRVIRTELLEETVLLWV